LELNELFREAVNGDVPSEEDLFRRLGVSFHVIAQHKIWDKSDAQEVVQIALITVAQKYRSLDADTSFAGWACKVLNNKVLDYIKSRKTAKGRAVEVQIDCSNVSVDDPDPILKSKLLECLKKIGRANKYHARILNLYYQGYTTKEICERLEFKPNNLYVRLSRARSLLELCLEKGDVK